MPPFTRCCFIFEQTAAIIVSGAKYSPRNQLLPVRVVTNGKSSAPLLVRLACCAETLPLIVVSLKVFILLSLPDNYIVVIVNFELHPATISSGCW